MTTTVEIDLIDNDGVDQVIKALRLTGHGVLLTLANKIEAARPGLPVPTAKQSVVEDDKGNIWVLADLKGGPGLCWFVSKSDGTYDWSTKPREKIVRIIHPGTGE
jgi:hypothetical protein